MAIDPFLTRQASAHPSFSAETATDTFFSLFLNTYNYIVFELFTYACHLMHASYTKKGKKQQLQDQLACVWAMHAGATDKDQQLAAS